MCLVYLFSFKKDQTISRVGSKQGENSGQVFKTDMYEEIVMKIYHFTPTLKGEVPARAQSLAGLWQHYDKLFITKDLKSTYQCVQWAFELENE